MSVATYLKDDTSFDDVSAFIAQQLRPFDTSKLDRFWLKFHAKKNDPGHGFCKYPKRLKKGSRQFKHHYLINAGVNQNFSFPYQWDVPVGTETHPNNTWTWVTENTTFEDEKEYLVWLCGHEAFHFLRHSRQVPGQNTQAQANAYGLEWLRLWRKQ